MLFNKHNEKIKRNTLFLSAPLMLAVISATFTIKANVMTHPRANATIHVAEYANLTTAKMTGGAALQGNYTINSAEATAGTNFKSFSDAADALLSAGVSGPVVFDVKNGSGPYAEQFYLDNITGTSETNTITINGNGNTIKFSSDDDSRRAVVRLDGASHVIINKLIIDATPIGDDYVNKWGYGIQLLNAASSNTIDGCTILSDSIASHFTANVDSWPHYICIALTGPNEDDVLLTNNNNFSNNIISGGYYSVFMSNKTVADSFINNTITNFNTYGMISRWRFQPAYTEGLVIEGNNIGNTKTGLVAIAVKFADNTIISKNIVHDMRANTVDGIRCGNMNDDPDSKTLVSNNLIYNLGHLPSDNEKNYHLVGIATNSPGNNYILHNTIALENLLSDDNCYGEGIVNGYFTDDENTVVQNNLVSITGQGKGHFVAAHISARPSPNTTGVSIFDHNDYSIEENPNNNAGWFASPGEYAHTISDWQNMVNKEANTLTIDPEFENAAAGDFIPTSKIFDDKGTPVNVADDIRGVVRSTVTPDIGAYEVTTCIPIHGQYTIDANAAPGTAKTFTSFNKAYEALACGIDGPVVFNVATTSHVYNEQLNMGPVDGSSAVNTVTFKGNGNTIKFSSDDDQHRAVIQFNGTSNFIFDSLIIDATPPAEEYTNRWGNGVQMFNSASGNTIHACTINTDTTTAHFVWDGSRRAYNGIVLMHDNFGTVSTDHNKFDNNTVNGGYFGIILNGPAKTDSFINNKVFHFYFYGILLQNSYVSWTSYNDSLFVYGNEVAHPSDQGLDGIYIADANNTIVSKNRIHDFKSDGISAIVLLNVNETTDSRTEITNNLIYDLGRDSTSGQPTFFVYGIHNMANGRFLVAHNTIALHNAAKSDQTAYVGFSQDVQPGPPQVFEFKNNLIVIDGAGKGLANCFSIFDPNVDATSGRYLIDNNNYFVGDNPLNAIGMMNGVAIPPLFQWQQVTGSEPHSSTIDPVFTDPANGNYKPTNFKMDNLGTPVGITTDILNVSRSSTKPDIGAYEFDACYPGFAKFSISNMQPCINENVFFKSTDTLADGSTVQKWLWEFGNDTKSEDRAGTTVYNKEGKYNVKLTATTNNGCIDDTTQTITVMDCEKQLYIPNAFSPNNDGQNDILQVYGNGIKEITLMIYNQWGEKIFESHNAAQGWDGKQNGKTQPAGVYMYVCKALLVDGKEITRKGSINLIR